MCVGGFYSALILYACICAVRSHADLCIGHFHSGGSFHVRGYEPILSLLLFVSALALHSRQLDLKLRLDFLWAVQVRKCLQCVCVSDLESLITQSVLEMQPFQLQI